MFDVRKFRAHLSSLHLLIFLFALGISAAAQDPDKDQDSAKAKPSKKAQANGAYVKVDGKVRCDKPDTEHSVEVPDRPGHVLILERRKCTWTEPLEIMGAKTTDGVAVTFIEKMEGSLHTHLFEVDTLDNGEKLTMQANGQILGEKGPATAKGRWNFMRGTGKYKGIKGVGSYEGSLEADGVLTVELEGVYDPSEMVGGKK